MEKVHLKRTKRLHAGSLWVFSNELHENPKLYAQGSLVEVYDMKESFIGIGYINPHSLISIRLLTEKKEAVDSFFIKRRVLDAISLREKLYPAVNGAVRSSQAMRIVFSEGDYLPGLIADLYGGCLVLQILTAGMEALKDVIIRVFDDVLSPGAIVLRNDSSIRNLEGIPLYKEVVKGSLSALPVIEEGGLRFEVDPLAGQKTGFFLDQRENRKAFKRLAAGFSKEGREIEALDLFCYTGAWALQLAGAGVKVTAVDESERAIAQAAKNAALNGLADRVGFVRDDVFSFLRKEAAGEGRYDVVVLDPPAFVKSKARLREAVKAYRELNALSMRLLKRGGLLATSSCSYHLGREMFFDMLRAASKESEKSPRLLELRSQAPDHPVLLSMPETEYLKCAFLMVD